MKDLDVTIFGWGRALSWRTIKIFLKKKFIVDGKAKEYTSYLNFTESTTNTKSNVAIQFSCIFCTVKFTYKLGQTSNVKRHLGTHTEIAKWMHAYNIEN